MRWRGKLQTAARPAGSTAARVNTAAAQKLAIWFQFHSWEKEKERRTEEQCEVPSGRCVSAKKTQSRCTAANAAKAIATTATGQYTPKVRKNNTSACRSKNT